MADVEKVRSGDKLRIVVDVVGTMDGESPVQIDLGGVVFWLRKSEVEAAEHVATQFKPGDFVRHLNLRHGQVVGTLGKYHPDEVFVTWPDESKPSRMRMWVNELKHDEAPYS